MAGSICENKKCLKIHDGSFASGRFCSLSCSQSFATSKNRDLINEKIRKKLLGRSVHDKKTSLHIGKKAAATRKSNRELRYKITDFESLSKRDKRRRIFEEQKGKCLFCSLSHWLGKQITFELDHIDGDIKNNSRDNLRLLCPNCHSQTPTWRRKKLAPIV